VPTVRPQRALAVLVACAFLALAGCGSTTTRPADGKGPDDKGAPADKAKEDAARAQIKVLEQAADTYKKNHGQYPEGLPVLALPDALNDNKPYISGDAILDPWGKAYQIDLAGTHNKGARADIFATTPGGKVIGNWDR
jgi:hypothetical protein